MITWPCDQESWYSSCPQDCNNQKDRFWQATIPRTLNTQQTKTQPQSLHEKKKKINPIYLALLWETGFKLPTQQEAKEAFIPREHKKGDTLFVQPHEFATD